jgi:hypothetical protein
VTVFAVLLVVCAAGVALSRGTFVPLPPPQENPPTEITPNPRVVSFAASDAASAQRAHLSARHLREIRDVLRASSTAERGRLIVSLPEGNDAAGIILFYGKPRFPDGLVPAAIAGDRPTERNGKPILILESFHPIGKGCTEYYLPTYGGYYAGTGAGCDDWKPSAADLIASAYDFPPGNTGQ